MRKSDCGWFHAPRATRHLFARRALVLTTLFVGAHLSVLQAQLPDHPRNLRVLPASLSTDSVFSLMLGVADALGTTCGHCHAGGDRSTWDSTNFASDEITQKVIARGMFRMTARLNSDLLVASLLGRPVSVPITCATCHRGLLRPITLLDTLSTILYGQGADSALAVRERIRTRYSGQMAYDLSDVPLRELGAHLQTANRIADAVRILEAAAREFPNSAASAYELGVFYEMAGKPALAITQYHKVLSLDPTDARAEKRLRTLMQVRPPQNAPIPSVAVQPARRSGFGLAFDSRRSRLVLFGGSDSTYVRLGDTWEWSSGGWMPRALAGPPARSDFAMTYDSRRGRVVVFGGRTAAGLSNETWEFDGDRWIEVDSTGPSARNLVSMAFDAKRGRTVLFGGSSTAKDSSTWEWDGHRWQRFPGGQSGPAARSSHVLVYDAARERVVLVGGYVDDAAVADSWEWDGATWTRVADGPAVFHAAAAYDAAGNRLLVFGGFDQDERSANLWQRTSAGWSLVNAATAPAERAEHRGAYVPGVGFVVFGGIAGQGMSLDERMLAKRNDLWAFEGTTWREFARER
jgi:Photosynthetic reaction centre cytochrome C subunit/Galactose oxidase, central domain